MSSNLERTLARMADNNVEAMLVSDIGNVRWLTGFTGSFGFAVCSANGNIFISDARYSVQAHEQVTNMEVVIFATPQKVLDVLAAAVKKLGVSKLGFEGSVTYATWAEWTKGLGGVTLEPQSNIIAPLRMIKTADEIAAVTEACKLADACFDHVQRMLKPGVVEFDIALDIEFFFRRHRATLAFDVIAVSGPNSAKPHGKPTEKKLEVGDFLTLDFGCGIRGYHSDITRTVVIGETSDKHKQIYNRVLESQVAAIEAMRPGANGRDVDILVREILDKDDLSQYFGHGLGHGLGSAVHDMGRLSMTTDQPIEVGQIWTIEPGVYLDGWGGVRIEDDIVITESGCDILTTSPKELMVCG
ncbi:MAG: aminopeptidase P family protein [Chthonomonas sp.]|nr:aminopeptidase P family protein [Chthonomonas sp.]